MDVDKHYKRKEYLLFPFLEKYGITGPSTVMWGKHDETRTKLKAAIELVSASGNISGEEVKTVEELVLLPAIKAITDMITREEEILFPMSMDKLTEEDWYTIDQQTMEFGYCLYDPQVEWKPVGVTTNEVVYNTKNSILLTTGSFSLDEIESLFKTLPIDINL